MQLSNLPNVKKSVKQKTTTKSDHKYSINVARTDAYCNINNFKYHTYYNKKFEKSSRDARKPIAFPVQ